MTTHASDPSPEEPVTRATLSIARLAERQVERVEIREIRMLPGQPAGSHVHNCPVVGTVLAGSVVLQVEGGPELLLTPGDTFYEPAGARILRFDAQDEGVTFQGYFLLAAGEQPELAFD